MAAAASSDAGLEMLRFLLDRGANVNARVGRPRQNALKQAIYSGDLAKAEVLLEAGADPALLEIAGNTRQYPILQLEGRMVDRQMLLDTLNKNVVLRQSHPQLMAFHAAHKATINFR